MTKQAYGAECDINNIMQRFTSTGQLPQGKPSIRYGLSEGDFQAEQYAIADGKSTFEQLAPDVKRKYGDFPTVLSALNNPDLASELQEDGIFQAFGLSHRETLQETQETPPSAPESESQAAKADSGKQSAQHNETPE